MDLQNHKFRILIGQSTIDCRKELAQMYIGYFLCDAGLKPQKFTKNVWVH